MLVLAVENHPEKQANCGDGDLYVLLFTVVYLQIYSIVFRKCHLSDIGQAIGQVPVLTRMNLGGSLILRTAASPRGARGIRSSHVQRTHALCPQRNRNRSAAPYPSCAARGGRGAWDEATAMVHAGKYQKLTKSLPDF